MTGQRVLIIGSIWVEPNSSAAGKRMLQLITLFLERGHIITFVSAAQKSAKAFDLTSLGIQEFPIELNNGSFDNFIKKLQPQIVLFDRFIMEEQFGWRVAEHCPEAIRILDTEDLHCLRKTREICLKKNIPFSHEELLKQDISKREIAAILRCDLSLIISPFEIEILKNTFKVAESILMYLPFLFDKIDVYQQQKWNPFEKREHFVFIGNFMHKPNIDAVLSLKNEIWCTIKKQLPKAEIHIYGAYLNKQIAELHNKKEGFIMKGFVENANEVVGNAKVVLAPLNFGAGTKGKLTEAMLCGTPSITTSIGAEGMHDTLPWNGFIEDDFSDFALKATELYIHKSLWEQAQLNGVAIINCIYNKEKNGKLLFNIIHQIQQNLERHRASNFLGRVLEYKILQASKYMSKWIEQKNRMIR